MFGTLACLFIYVVLGTLAGVVGIPYTWLVGDISLLYRTSMSIIRAGLRAARVQVVVTGLDRVPAGRAAIYLSNHVSNLDPPVLLPVIPGRTSVLLKRELMKIPILGYAMRMGDFIPVERGSRREAAQQSVTAAAAVLRKGLNILVFAEGTRSKDGRLASFKKGPFFLAQQTGAPIVPVAITGTQHLMRKGSPWIVPGTARVQLLDPIEPAAYATREELTAAVHAAIARALPPEMQPPEMQRPVTQPDAEARSAKDVQPA